jgi:hypothetical protein
MSDPPQAIAPNHHTNLLNVYIQVQGFQKTKQKKKLPRQLGSAGKLVHSSTDQQGSSVTSEEAHTDCITSVNKVMHQLISRIICVMVVIEPTPIHPIAYIYHPATPTNW